MNAQELIEALRVLPPETEVVSLGCCQGCLQRVDRVTFHPITRRNHELMAELSAADQRPTAVEPLDIK